MTSIDNLARRVERLEDESPDTLAEAIKTVYHEENDQ